MKYKFKGFSAVGAPINGEIEGEDPQQIRAHLRSQGVWVKHLEVLDGGAEVGKTKIISGSGANMQINLGGLFESKPSPSDFTAFIRQLSTMINAGIPIVAAIGLLGEQVTNKALSRTLKDMKLRIEKGQSLTEAIKAHPKIFDRIFLNLSAAGEASGTMDKVLLRLATHYEKSTQINRKVKGAMTYPLVMSGIISLVVIVLLWKVVPTFAEMFASSGKALPGPTQLVLDLSNFIQEHIFIILATFIGSIVGVLQLFQNSGFRKIADPLIIKIPFLGPLIQKVSVARFSRTLSTMIEAGVPILESLIITSRVAGNYAVENAVLKARTAVQTGQSLSGPLAESNAFPKMATSMIAVGEQTGALSQMLAKIAEFYEDEVDAAVSSISSIIEPVMMLLVGVVTAAILIPMYLPLFQMGDLAGGGG